LSLLSNCRNLLTQ